MRQAIRKKSCIESHKGLHKSLIGAEAGAEEEDALFSGNGPEFFHKLFMNGTQAGNQRTGSGTGPVFFQAFPESPEDCGMS